MSKMLESAFVALLNRIIELAKEDDELRTRVRTFAMMVLESTEDISDAEASTTEAIADGETAITPEPDTAPSKSADDEAPTPTSLPELTLGQATQPDDPSPSEYLPPPLTITEIDFNLIESRCRLKAEGSRWAAERHRLMLDGASFSLDVDPKDRELISRAKSIPDCFLWMNHPNGPSPSNPNLYLA